LSGVRRKGCRGYWCSMVRFPLPSWGLSVVQQGPHGGVSVWLPGEVVPVAVVEDGGLEVFGPVVFFDAEHEGHHVVISFDEGDVQGGFGAHRISPWWVIQWWTAFRSAFSCLMCSPPCPHFSHSQVQVWMRGHHFSRRILMLGMFTICS